MATPSLPALPPDLPSLLDVPVLDAAATEEQVHAACSEARSLGLALVTVRPADLTLAAKWMQGGPTAVGSVVSFPFGDETTAVKNYATRDLLGRGARNIETVLNLGKMLSRQFQYVELELLQMAQECHRAGATLTLDLELPRLAADHRVIALKIARRIEADFVRAAGVCSSTGSACSPEDLAFLAARLGEDAKLDAGPVETLAEAIAAHNAGAARMLSREPATLIASWREETARRERETGTQAV